ncbi:ABC-type branched-chain amino acid transport system, periplasmic component [Herbaspirillum sp. CF444]|uniref:ABC transporter substrate-binding protein n=1 Tax=Herbaspirillum sp. CF444 TaxID=1144319 RepID=UPI0002728375|nr:ABC transporter substrate-binding protein [Herbaspirillum sp. CF444]EJL93272.1 ABC-type branched-chain amino acid transport system, periplasmic component [Herbaspirillum sp. CF444]
MEQDDNKVGSRILSPGRRTILKAGAVAATTSALGFPAIVKAQSDKIIIGHLTPRTGFLGPLGEYAVMSITLAVEEQNKAGGLLGRQLTLISEDSVNPPTASSKAQRLLERDGAAVLIGEISSASALGIAQVAQRNKKLFMNTGCNSDELRGKSCNKYMFHIEAANSTYVKACGRSLLHDNLIKGKKLYALSADYAFGHDLLRAAKSFVSANGGTIANDELVPTDATDFSPYLLKIRQAKPDLVISNLAGNQITNFIKQYSEFGLPFPIAGFGFDTAVAWGAGADNFAGTWPTTWHHDVNAPSAKAFVAAFTKKFGKPPENQAWGEYVAFRSIVQAVTETKSLDTARLIEYFEKGAPIDALKARKGTYRAWDHQLLQEMYTVTPKPKAQIKDKWDFMLLGASVPGPSESLEVLAPTMQENACTFT